MEKKRAKQPERFGKGAPEGVAGPETANNAAATSSFIPLLTLGIPANATMALMFGGALLIQGVTPGPPAGGTRPGTVLGRGELHVHRQHPAADHEPAARGNLCEDPPRPCRDPGSGYSLITLLGAYTINNSMFDVTLVVVFGVVGYLMKKFGFEPGPLVLAFVLGELLESSMRRSLLVFGGDPLGFFGRSISATLLVVFVVVALLPVIRTAITKRTSITTAVTPDIKEKV